MPVELFYSYSHKDEGLRDELERHLQVLQRSGHIRSWHDRRINPGAEWADAIDSHISSAQIVLLLISADFLASDYCYGEEMRVALERHDQQLAVVIPVILRPVDWSGAPFARLQALPPDGKPITLWRNRDEAFTSVAREIRDVVTSFGQPVSRAEAPWVLEPRSAHQERILDAALPSHIALHSPTELLVLIRRPESEGLAGILVSDDESEAQPEDVRSKPFEITFPLGPAGVAEPLKVTIEVTSPDFSPPSQRKNVMVPVDADSPVSSFVLRPLRLGELMAIVELQWEDAQRGYRRLRTNCVAEVEPGTTAPMHVARMPLVIGTLTPAGTRIADVSPPAPLPLPVAAPAERRPLPPAASAPSRRKSIPLRYGTIAAAALALCVVGTVGITFLQPRYAPRPAPAPVSPADRPRPDGQREEPAVRPHKPRVLGTVRIQAAGCESATNPINLQIPKSYDGLRIELQQITKDGNAGFRNIRVDPVTRRLTGELYAVGAGTSGRFKTCLDSKVASASYSVVAVSP